MNVIKNYCTAFKRYGEKRQVTDSVEIHSIGCAQDEAEKIRNNMNQYSPSGIVSAIVDAKTEGKVVECLPLDNVTWADAGYGNGHSITIELAESCEMRYKSNSAEYTVVNEPIFKKNIKTAYDTAVKYVADICKQYGFNPKEKMSNGLYRVYSHREANLKGLASGHVDPNHVWYRCGYSMDGFRQDVYNLINTDSVAHKTEQKGTVWADMDKLSSDIERAEFALKTFAPIVAEYGLFPSDMIARGILESGFYHTTELSKSNNCFGIKASLLNDQWSGSVWDGKTVTIHTPEYYNGQLVYIDDKFRVYPCIEDGIRDLCAFFTTLPKYVNNGVLNAKSGKEQASIIAKSGYATDPNYASKIQNIIDKYELDRYDYLKTGTQPKEETKWYRVGTAWVDGKCKGQIGAYSILENAIKNCPSGYAVFDSDGKTVHINTTSKEYEIINKAVQFALDVAHDDSIGYFNGGYKPNEGYCCISLVVFAYINAGLNIPYCNVWDADSVFASCGFEVLPATTKLRKGDLLWRDRHIAIMVSDTHLVEACGDYDGQRGDSSGSEIFEHEYYPGGWKKVLRYPVPDAKTYRVQVGAFLAKGNADKRASLVLSKTRTVGYNDGKGYSCFQEKDENDLIHVYCGSFSIKENADRRCAEIVLATKREVIPIIKEN